MAAATGTVVVVVDGPFFEIVVDGGSDDGTIGFELLDPILRRQSIQCKIDLY